MSEADPGLFPVPDAAAAPDVGSLPEHFGKINNLAGDEELCRRFWAFVSQKQIYYQSQPERNKFVRKGGTMDQADRMQRVALNRDTTSKQHQNTLSNVTSTMFFRQMRTVTANLLSVYFPSQGELPAEYSPEIGTDEYTIEEGKDIAHQQNTLAEYTFDEDKRRAKIKRSIFFNNKYGQEIVSIEWVRETQERTERVPIVDKVTGERTGGFRFETKRRTVRDWPVFMRHAIENCYFDAQIDGDSDTPNAIDKQECFLKVGQKSWTQLANEQADGFIMNVDKITSAGLYRDEETSTLADRKENADEDNSPQETGKLKEWHAWAWVQIKESSGKDELNGKGVWNDKSTAPSLYWGTFIGEISSDAVCTRLIKNPSHDGKMPYFMMHSLDDDKGAYHMCFASMLASNYWQATTNANQNNDNITLRTRAPLVQKGQVYTRNLKYRQNMVIKMAPGASLEPITVADTTQVTQITHDRIERDSDQTTGADRPVQGQSLGSRASATEAKQTLDQSLLPLDEMAEFIGDPFFTWMFERDAMLWRLNGDPDKVRSISHSDQIISANPAELWGPVKTKVTAISRFRNNVVHRQEINSAIQGAVPAFKEVMGESGLRELARQSFATFGFEHVNKLVPLDGDWDARSIATQENSLMRDGGFDLPTDRENHSAHLLQHKPFLRQYELMPKEEQDQQIMLTIKTHIEVHEQLLQASEGTAAQQAQGQQGATPEMAGQVMGDQIASQEGAAAGGV